MPNVANESVGKEFRTDLLQAARNKTLQVIQQAAQLIRPGMTESDAKTLIQKMQTQLGAPKSWHPPQIRFGANTLLPFGAKGQTEIPLCENDIFFFDLGPIFELHEGDVGRTFSMGSDPEMQACCRDIETIWHDIRNYWMTTQATGPELYDFAKHQCQAKGWEISLELANGHRISDFPHVAKMRGSVENFPQKPAPNRWILELQIRHPTRKFGAFFEDLLN